MLWANYFPNTWDKLSMLWGACIYGKNYRDSPRKPKRIFTWNQVIKHTLKHSWLMWLQLIMLFLNSSPSNLFFPNQIFLDSSLLLPLPGKGQHAEPFEMLQLKIQEFRPKSLRLLLDVPSPLFTENHPRKVLILQLNQLYRLIVRAAA